MTKDDWSEFDNVADAPITKADLTASVARATTATNHRAFRRRSIGQLQLSNTVQLTRGKNCSSLGSRRQSEVQSKTNTF